MYVIYKKNDSSWGNICFKKKKISKCGRGSEKSKMICRGLPPIIQKELYNYNLKVNIG